LLKVLQVKIQEHTSYMFRNSKVDWLDQLRESVDQSRCNFAEFK